MVAAVDRELTREAVEPAAGGPDSPDHLLPRTTSARACCSFGVEARHLRSEPAFLFGAAWAELLHSKPRALGHVGGAANTAQREQGAVGSIQGVGALLG